MEKAFPNEKPAFLFDDIERNTHSAISADAYRVLKADRDALQKRIDKATESYQALRQDKDSIEGERDSLKAMVDKYSALSNHPDVPKPKNSNLLKSQYWNKLKNLVEHSISEYPGWRETQRRIQKTGNLQDWLTQAIGADNREAEILKKVLSDFFQELR